MNIQLVCSLTLLHTMYTSYLLCIPYDFKYTRTKARTHTHAMVLHSKLILLSKQALSSRHRHRVPFLCPQRKERLSCTQMNGLFWWNAEPCLLPLHLFTGPFFKSTLSDTLPNTHRSSLSTPPHPNVYLTVPLIRYVFIQIHTLSPL